MNLKREIINTFKLICFPINTGLNSAYFFENRKSFNEVCPKKKTP